MDTNLGLDEKTSTCKQCGIIIPYYTKVHKKERQFCSKSCATQYLYLHNETLKNRIANRQGQEYKCEYCKIIFYRYPADIKSGEKKFCSRECYLKKKGTWIEKITDKSIEQNIDFNQSYQIGSETTKKGNISTLAISLALTRIGKIVLSPIGEGYRYDLVIDEEGKFSRIQCKTGKLINGVILFSTSSVGPKGVAKYYLGQIEYFGVFCPQLNKSYLIPVTHVGKAGTLRIDDTKNKRQRLIRWAKDYEIQA